MWRFHVFVKSYTCQSVSSHIKKNVAVSENQTNRNIHCSSLIIFVILSFSWAEATDKFCLQSKVLILLYISCVSGWESTKIKISLSKWNTASSTTASLTTPKLSSLKYPLELWDNRFPLAHCNVQSVFPLLL